MPSVSINLTGMALTLLFAMWFLQVWSWLSIIWKVINGVVWIRKVQLKKEIQKKRAYGSVQWKLRMWINSEFVFSACYSIWLHWGSLLGRDIGCHPLGHIKNMNFRFYMHFKAWSVGVRAHSLPPPLPLLQMPGLIRSLSYHMAEEEKIWSMLPPVA